MPHGGTDKELTHGQKSADMEELKKEVIDPASDVINDENDPRVGHRQFLAWESKKDDNGEPYYEAVGQDGKIYRILSDEEKPKKKAKVEII